MGRTLRSTRSRFVARQREARPRLTTSSRYLVGDRRERRARSLPKETDADHSVGIILSTTRTGRFADKVAAWLLELVAARRDMEFELVDLRGYPLPLFDEPISPLFSPAKNEVAYRWAKKIESFDAGGAGVVGARVETRAIRSRANRRCRLNGIRCV